MEGLDTVTINGKEIQVHELTVAQVRTWLTRYSVKDKLATANAPVKEPDVVSAVLFSDITLDDIFEMTTATPEFINDCTPSQVRLLADHCKAVNSHFFAMLDRLKALGEKAILKK